MFNSGVFFRASLATAGVVLLSFGLSGSEMGWVSLWPSLAALILVLVCRSALWGLLVGGLCGAVLLADGSVYLTIEQFLLRQFWPIFSSPWKLSAILFTLILGGFVALVEAGGGLQGLVRRLLGTRAAPHKRMQYTVFGFGLLVFFDGLANTMLLGRLLRSAADRCGVSRVKLAYLSDTTGSAVACLAFISTWIAFQLSMIREGFVAVGQMEVSAYGYFFRSLSTNFYCWFALLLALVCVRSDFNPGPMGRSESLARSGLSSVEPERVLASHWGLAIVPILVLTFSIPVIAYLVGAEEFWPLSFDRFAVAYARAESFVPQILVASSVLAAFVAACTYARANRRFRGASATSVFTKGVSEILKPVLILVCAWLLGSAISQLGTADWLGRSLEGRFPLVLVPAGIFLIGGVISFSTGTSWGTMGVLMPLAIPLIFGLAEGVSDFQREALVVSAIGAVFSGAVFGDHCSPFSDTTIVASIASGVEPFDHVRTQMPFALIAAGISLIAGFVPLGLGVNPWFCLAIGGVCIFWLPYFSNMAHRARSIFFS